MVREQLDALAFESPDYFKFATNFTVDVSGFERPGVCVVPRDGEPFVVMHELSMNNRSGLSSSPAKALKIPVQIPRSAHRTNRL